MSSIRRSWSPKIRVGSCSEPGFCTTEFDAEEEDEAGADADADAEEVEEEERFVFDDALFVFLRLPPPTGMFLRAPPLVQYLLQFLQKWRGCERL